MVSTLRFWIAAEQPAVAARRRRVQQPWSLLLQLVSMALLLLAISQLRLGTPAQAGRDHVIVLDTSAWMAGRSGNRSLMDVARDRARQYLKALPLRDRVMLVRADGMATPATAFEVDRNKIEDAVKASQPGATALNLDQALVFARHIQGQDGHRVGEHLYRPTDSLATPVRPRRRAIPRHLDSRQWNGTPQSALRRSGADSSSGNSCRGAMAARSNTVTLSLDFDLHRPAVRRVTSLILAPGAESEASSNIAPAPPALASICRRQRSGRRPR